MLGPPDYRALGFESCAADFIEKQNVLLSLAIFVLVH